MLLDRPSTSAKVLPMRSSYSVNASHVEESHFSFRPRSIVRATLIFVLILGTCADVVGAFYLRQQYAALNGRVQDVAMRLVRPPLMDPVAKFN